MSNKYASFNENDIRPDELMDGARLAYQNDMRWLLSREADFVEVNCPACDSSKCEDAFEKNNFHYKKCVDCLTVYISPRPSLPIITDFYQNSEGYKYWAETIFPASEAVRKEALFRPRVKEVIELCKSLAVNNNLLVEVGAGFGTFSQIMREEAYFDKVISIEPNSDLAEQCEIKGLDVVNVAVEDLKLQTKADVVVSFEVIEHLFSVNEFLIGCKQLLKQNGLAIFSCPNFHGFDNLTLGIESSTVDYKHLNYFNPESLKHLLERNGFNVIKVKTPGKLDADLVRKHALSNTGYLDKQPFLKCVLLEKWDELGAGFQEYLADNNLSGHMWIVATVAPI